MQFVSATVALIMLALGLVSNAAAEKSDVVATWTGGIHFLPGSITRSGKSEQISFRNGESLEQWRDRLAREVIKPGTKIPAVVYAHGCKGPVAAALWAVSFNDFGFAFFAPDSFKRPGRVLICYQKNKPWRIPIRHEEIRNAIHQIMKLKWIDKNRIILVGKSEGGRATAAYGGKEFLAHIIMAYDCKWEGRRPRAPRGVAVLNIVGSRDRREKLCTIRRKVGGSKAISLNRRRHDFSGDAAADTAIAEFLTKCCGYKPKDTTGRLDADTTAKKLVDELGGMATMDAMLKADEALAKGDKEGHSFWMRVHGIATKINGG